MCLYPKLVYNPKYKVNKKNGGNVPIPSDPRVLYVPIGCQKCIECKKQKARDWQVRLLEELRTDSGIFVTLTMSTERYIKIKYKVSKKSKLDGYDLDNAIIIEEWKRFSNHWKTETGKRPKHWLISELGHNGTENIHLHGILFTKDRSRIKKLWKSFVYLGDYCNARTVNYMIKYVLKVDKDHQYYDPRILTSPGMGSNYLKRPDSNRNQFDDTNTIEYYTTREGFKISLPIYYRNKLYNDDEKERLWLNKLNKQERWILGQRIDISLGDDEYQTTLAQAQRENVELGYTDMLNDKEAKEYERKRRNIINETRIQKHLKKLENGR
jgi:hypothetical protein